MNRRELLKLIAAATGTTLIGGSSLLAGCASLTNAPAYSLNTQTIALLDEVAETIIPRTDTPGAKDARVGELMAVMVADCYTDQQRETFLQGLPQIDALAQRRYGQKFVALPKQQKHELISRLDRVALRQTRRPSMQLKPTSDAAHYFTMIKQLTLFGFFTSEVGAKEVLRYVAVPGYYDGALPYEEGDRAWATT